MRVGLIDVDGVGPNYLFMVISTYHKGIGDEVEWYSPFTDTYDIVYMYKSSKESEEYDLIINSHEVVKGGPAYMDELCFYNLPSYILKLTPDYTLYPGINEKNKTKST